MSNTGFPPPLHIVTPIFNPRRFERRYELYRHFEKQVKDSGAILWTVELALHERPFEVTESNNPHHIQLRSDDEWFVKENLINIGISRLPFEVKYFAWCDCDIKFINVNWATETIQMLQHHPIVQMFSQVVNLSPKDEAFQLWNGFAYSHQTGRPYRPIGGDYNYWHPGFAWAYRREAFDAVGGLMEQIPLGSADSHMAGALIGKTCDTVHGRMPQVFKDYCFAWEAHAQKFLKHHGQTIGHVPGLLGHYWHGRMKDRKYKERWDILVEHKFNPYTDMIRGTNNLWRIADHKYGLRLDIQTYLANRNEDCIWFNKCESTINQLLNNGSEPGDIKR